MIHAMTDEGQEIDQFEVFFREPSLAVESPLAWSLSQRTDVLAALSGLVSGTRAITQLRLWVFLEFAAQPHGRLQRDDLLQLFYALKPDALESVLKRLRELELIVWDSTNQDYHFSPLAQQLHAILAPLTRATSDDDEMALLLTHVAGAQALGLADPNQIKHLHARLGRLYDEFADAIASGSEARLREAQPRFERAILLVERAGVALTALIRSEHDDPRLEREARALGGGQARLLTMASQFNRALQQADRRRVTLGSTGVTSSDVRAWLQTHPAPCDLAGDSLSPTLRPVFVSGRDMLDVAEAELERDRPNPEHAAGLPPPREAEQGMLEVARMPEELGTLIAQLEAWFGSDASEFTSPRPAAPVVLGGRFAQASYRMQLLPMLGDAKASELQGQTGDLARLPCRAAFLPEIETVDDANVAALSRGYLYLESKSSNDE